MGFNLLSLLSSEIRLGAISSSLPSPTPVPSISKRLTLLSLVLSTLFALVCLSISIISYAPITCPFVLHLGKAGAQIQTCFSSVVVHAHDNLPQPVVSQCGGYHPNGIPPIILAVCLSQEHPAFLMFRRRCLDFAIALRPNQTIIPSV